MRAWAAVDQPVKIALSRILWIRRAGHGVGAQNVRYVTLHGQQRRGRLSQTSPTTQNGIDTGEAAAVALGTTSCTRAWITSRRRACDIGGNSKRARHGGGLGGTGLTVLAGGAAGREETCWRNMAKKYFGIRRVWRASRQAHARLPRLRACSRTTFEHDRWILALASTDSGQRDVVRGVVQQAPCLIAIRGMR